MSFEFTEEQKKAIYSKGTTLVAAAAGSGKTAVLTKRVIELLCNAENPTSIDRLLIVTFTNASALEMRIRISKALDEQIFNLTDSQRDLKQKLIKQKILIKSAKICTIDSFCIELVRKHFSNLGISPDFKIADDAEAANLKEQAWQTVISPYYSEKHEDFESLTKIFNVYKGDNSLKDAVTTVYDFSLCLSKSEKWFDNTVNNYCSQSLYDNTFANTVLNDVKMKVEGVIDCYNLLLRESIGSEFYSDWQLSFGESIDYLQSVCDNIDSKDWDAVFTGLSEFSLPRAARIKKGQNESLHGKMKEIRERSKRKISSAVNEMAGDEAYNIGLLNKASRPLNVFIELVHKFSDEYFKLLNSRNLLTFALIEQLSLKLLCNTENNLEPTRIANEISGLYDEVLVDEYQDNNDLQDALFKALSDNGNHLFMVGDVKQCIYAFRNAEPDNFLQRKKTYHYYDGVHSPSQIILSANFRSRKGICDFVNGICSAVMQEKTCGLDYTDDEILVPNGKFPDNGTICTDVYLTEYSDARRDIADAESVADYIETVMAEEPFLKTNNNSNNDIPSLRKAEYGDFAILLRSPNARVKFYTDALKKRGIPVSFNTNEFFQSPEILTIVSILKVIDNPTADIPLISAMSSVAFGFTFDEIVDIKSDFHGRNMYQKLIDSEKSNNKSKFMLKTLADLRTSAVTMSVSALILEVYRTTYLKEIMSSADNGFERKNNLSAFVSFASEYENKGEGSLSGFLAYFDRLSARGKTPDKMPNKSNNAVRIMSFHGSKGLQFPICIVAGCGNGFNTQDLKQPMIINGKLGIGLNYIDGQIKCDTLAKRALKCAQQLKLISEEIRLLYVAMTRAEEKLMISISSKDCAGDIIKAADMITLESLTTGKLSPEQVLSADSPKKFLLAALMLQNDGFKIAKIAGINPIDFSLGGEYRFRFNHYEKAELCTETFIKNTDSAENVISDELSSLLEERFDKFNYQYSNETLLPSKMAVTELVHGDRDRFAFKLRPRFMSKSGLTPAERGTALHKIMQYADFAQIQSDLDAELLRLYEYEFISEEEFNSIDKNALKMFFYSEVFKRIQNAEKVLREYKFMVHHPIEGGQTIVQGIADCIFFENGQAVILDFKTDNVSAVSILSERYSKQLQIYKSAIAEIFEVDVKECIIYSTYLNDYINV